MKETLFLKLQNEKPWLQRSVASDEDGFGNHLAEETLTAAYYDRSGEVDTFHGTAEELTDWVNDVRGDLFDLTTVAILSGVNLVSMQVNIPSKQAKHVAQALPFMLEDLVAQDVEELHIATGVRSKSGELPVMLSERAGLDALIENLQQQGIKLTSAYADMACLPAAEDTWNFLTDGKSLIATIGLSDALTIELDALPVLLNSLFSDEDASPEKICVTISNDHMSENLENWLKTQFTSHLGDVDAEFDIAHSDYTHFLYLCDGVRAGLGETAINLLQGDFQPVSERRPSAIKWKPMTVLASVFVLLFVGFQYTQVWKIEEQTASVDQQAKSLYKRYFPRDRNVTDIKRRMAKKLEAVKNAGDDQGFLVLLTMVGEKLNELNRGAGSPRLSPTRITYDQGQGDLKIDFIAGGFADLDELKAKLESASLTVEIARASQDGDKMKARMNVRSAG